MEIKIVFFNGDSFLSKLIKFGTKCDYSHVGLVGDETENEYIIYEAKSKGLVKTPFSKQDISERQKNGKVLIKTINLNTTKDKLKSVCEKYLGSNYDWINFFNIGFYILFKMYALKIKGIRHLICSEFVARVLYDLGFNLSAILNKDYDYITPADILNFLLKFDLLNYEKLKR